MKSFNTQPPEGGCTLIEWDPISGEQFQHTATRRWLQTQSYHPYYCSSVSTHSHPKVAAIWISKLQRKRSSFNTQPPEGGCYCKRSILWQHWRFNTQPPEGGCDILYFLANLAIEVSTHSHPKVAATGRRDRKCGRNCFNTQPPEGGCRSWLINYSMLSTFQHTATRRWLRLKN